MTSKSKNLKNGLLLVMFLMVTTLFYGQAETNKWKLLFAVGVNNPIDEIDNDQFYSKHVNFPAISLGIQHMFSESLGAKIDYSYNRSTNADSSAEFKLNYSRANVQLVYDAYHLMTFLPPAVNVVGHVGPGMSFSKPLNAHSDNTYTYLNLLAGIEIHYAISDALSIYGDVSYAFGLSNEMKYDPAVDGYSFNGDVLSLTIGLSVSLSGCQFCY